METNPSTAVTCLPLLTPAECDDVLARLTDWTDGMVEVPSGGGGYADLRRCQVADLSADPIAARIEDWVSSLNQALFQFVLDGRSATDPPLAMRYRAGDHFDWHIDNATLGSSTRKLSFTVQLSEPTDYDGGDLELALYKDPHYATQIRQRGHITIFPSFHLHRVAPVTRGARVALVGWLHGPRFK